MKYNLKIQILSVLILGVVSSGCSSKNVMIEKSPPVKYKTLGKVENTGSGSLLLYATAYNFIPVGLNSRSQRAYDNTLEEKEESTQLINVTYQENWFWWILGTNRTVTISGEAIKEISE